MSATGEPTSFTKRLDVLIAQFAQFHGDSAAAVAQSVERLKTAGVVSGKTLVDLLMQPTTPVSLRLDACWLLPRIGLERAERTLVTLLSDEDPRVRAEAAMSLGLLSNDTVVDPLVDCLKTDPELQVRLAAIHALGILSDPKSAPCLQALMSNPNEDASVRADATEALAHVDADGVIDALLSALQDPCSCVTGTHCDINQTNRCIPTPKRGEPCPSNICLEGDFCNNYATPVAICESIKAVGEPCLDATACVTGYCINSLCAPYPNAGEPCTGECRDDLYCQAGVCTVKQQLGQSCSFDLPCAAGLSCNGSVCEQGQPLVCGGFF